MSNLRRVITNTISNKQIVQESPTQNEIEVFDESVFISETDAEGNIVYMNRRFVNVTGFDRDELLGAPHSIIRHPDMPKGVFKAMWNIITKKKIWRGYIKHMTKDGSFFWTLTYIHAKLDDEGNIMGYSSNSKSARKSSRAEVEAQYEVLKYDKHIDNKYFMQSENYYSTQILPKVFDEPVIKA